MRKQIIVTDITRMRGTDVCVAGVETEPPYRCLRPQLTHGQGYRPRHPDEHWLHSALGGPVRPFSLISLDELGNNPSPPHTEDWIVHDAPAQVHSVLKCSERRALLESLQRPSIDDLFGTEVRWNQDPEGMRSSGCTEPGSGVASLGTLRARLHDMKASARFDNALRYDVGFSDEIGTWNQLKITDLSFISWASSLHQERGSSPEDLTRLLRSLFRKPELEVWLRIGLARPFTARGSQKPMCYLQVTGVYTFPDYLDGATWCDFERPAA